MNGYESQNRQRRGGAAFFFYLLLTVLPIFVFYIFYSREYRSVLRYVLRGSQLLILLYFLRFVLLLSMYGGYRLRQYRTRELVFSFGMASMITNLVAYAVFCMVARRMLPIGHILLILVIQWAVAIVIYILARILLPRLEPDIAALYICRGGEDDLAVERKFDSRRTNYRVAETVTEDLAPEELHQAMAPYGAVLLGNVSSQLRQEIIGYCFRTGRKVLLVPNMTDIVMGSAAPMVVGDYLLYDLNTQGADLPYEVAKRGLDILASAIGLLVLSPLMLLTALAVKLQDGGPVFYRQVRLTRGGKRFMLTKFRSMIVNAESATGAVLAGKDDRRITPVGKVIRATRLDELPQLWNILRGDMSLVGPRPERPEFYEQICEEYPEFDYRLKVKAGLTGYAQLYGKYNTSFADKARLDMYYIQHASFLWDLQMIFYTLKIIFIRESTEGVDTPQGPAAPEKEKETLGSSR